MKFIVLLCILYGFVSSCAIMVGATAGGAIGYYIGKESLDSKKNKDSEGRVKVEIED